MIKQKTFQVNANTRERKWHHVDASGQTVGRLATRIADILRGKNKSTFTPHVDSGDFVVVTNCEKVVFTGKKWEDKEYFWHTNHVGGIKKRTARQQRDRHPELILMEAVKGMLPKNTLGRMQLTKFKVFAGEKHHHEAQRPESLTFEKRER